MTFWQYIQAQEGLGAILIDEHLVVTFAGLKGCEGLVCVGALWVYRDGRAVVLAPKRKASLAGTVVNIVSTGCLPCQVVKLNGLVILAVIVIPHHKVVFSQIPADVCMLAVGRHVELPITFTPAAVCLSYSTCRDFIRLTRAVDFEGTSANVVKCLNAPPGHIQPICSKVGG